MDILEKRIIMDFVEKRAVFKFKLTGHENIFNMPQNAIPLGVKEQRGVMVLYCDCPVEMPKEKNVIRTFVRLETGVYFPKDTRANSKFQMAYVATVMSESGNYVEHVFEVLGSTDEYHEALNLF